MSFFRGGRCPFCTAELCALQAQKDEFESVGVTLAVVTPETRDFPRQLKRSLGLDLKVLSDIDWRRWRVVWRIVPGARRDQSALFRARVRPRPRRGPPDWMPPLPATYVIETEGPDPRRVRRA